MIELKLSNIDALDVAGALRLAVQLMKNSPEARINTLVKTASTLESGAISELIENNKQARDATQ